MQILAHVVEPIAINMMDDLTRRRARNFAVLPSFAVSPRGTRAGAQPLRVKCLPIWAVRSFRGGVCRHGICNRSGDDLVSTPHVLARRQSCNFPRIGVQRIAVPVPHLVVTHAHLAGDDGPPAVCALPPNHLPAPAVIRRAMPLDALVVHQAEAVRRMFSAAAINVAETHNAAPCWVAHCITYKQMGKSRRRIQEAIALPSPAPSPCALAPSA